MSEPIPPAEGSEATGRDDEPQEESRAGDGQADPPAEDADRDAGDAGRSIAAGARRVHRSPRLLMAVKAARELLPGDSSFGDPLSTAGEEGAQVAGRRFSALTDERPGLVREAGLSALQVWQAVSEGRGRGRGERDLAIVFTDLVGFSSWALEAGDTATLDLLRDVGLAIEPAVKEHRGTVVKRLGDGLMAVFEHPQDGVEAIFEARERLARIEAEDFEPRIRAGMHFGRPRKLGGDYLGVDVNIAARVAEHASGGELLVSDRVAAMLDRDSVRLRKKRLFRVKGLPRDVTTYSAAPQR